MAEAEAKLERKPTSVDRIWISLLDFEVPSQSLHRVYEVIYISSKINEANKQVRNRYSLRRYTNC